LILSRQMDPALVLSHALVITHEVISARVNPEF